MIIDPGHGGKDHGAVENGVKEKDINLSVAKYLAKLLEKKKDNIKVVMTRDKDNFITLQKRADIANENKGNLFISIHTNSVDKSNKNRKNVAGSSVYTLGLNKDENNMKVAQRENSVIEMENDYTHKYSGFDPTKDESYIIFQMAQKKDLVQSIKFAEQAQSKLVSKAHRGNRGVHQAGFWVLWATSMPAVLVELDFICNPKSAKYLSSETGHKEMAEALYEAIVEYVDTFEHKNTPIKAGIKNNRAKSKTSAVQSKSLQTADRHRRSESFIVSSDGLDFE
ncbi:MAG: N-acetylmuramoyl-L-alanine amidase, partial [Muribaculaceae bacterium]|nr:N-acetylmuramoyl-L-alanine amidase [Muribaculaceae bacterium]